MSSQNKWKAGKRDVIFLIIAATVIVMLVLGTGKRTTRAAPDDDTHRHAVTRAQCMRCHGSEGIRPRPRAHHVRGDQCFQCHQQPAGWVGVKP